MLFDLIKALPVAILVGIVPGWFWAKLLIASADRYERIAYSVTLSMALVPAVILVATRLLDTGVTLTVAVVSIALVFFLGLAAYLRFGPAKGLVKPLTPPPASLGALVLVPLVLAFVLVLGVVAGVMPGVRIEPSIVVGVVPSMGVLLAVSLLVLFAGIMHLIEPRREPAPQPQERLAGSQRPPAVLALLLAAVLLLALWRGYLGPVLHDWPFIRGGDQFSHAVMARLMMTEGKIDSYLIYPPGFHTMTALISRLSGLEPLEIFPVLAPALTVLPPLACYALARQLWGRSYGVVAAFFSSVLLVGPYESFAEARYPNLVSANFLMVMAVAALVGVYGSPQARSGLLLALLGSSVVLYHQVASLYLTALLALVGVLFVPYLLLMRDRRKGLVLFSSLSLLGFLSILYAWDTYDPPRLLLGLLGGSEMGAGGTAVAIAIGSQEPLSLGHLLETTSQPVAWLGLLGAFLAAGELLRRRVGVPQALVYLTLLLWALLLFVGSRTSLSGFPQRFERDLGIPLVIFAALSFVAILRSAEPHALPASLSARVAAVLVAILAIAAGLQAAENLRDADRPSTSVISQEVAAAGEWLGDHNTGGNIVVTPYLNDHIPGSAMLAMGSYTGLRSYTREQLRSPRALPPSGKESLLAAQWVRRYPVGKRTGSTLARYDIRYVVLFKRYPGVRWRAFEKRSGFYAKPFENSAVIIFAPRGTASPPG